MPDNYKSKELTPSSIEYTEQAPMERDPVSGAPESTSEKQQAARVPEPNKK